MKIHRNILITIAASCIAILASCQLFTTVGVPLAELGLEIAAEKGVIKDGDTIKIANKAAAIIVSEDGLDKKAIALTELGAQVAVDQGKLSPGDKLYIDKGAAIVIPAIVK